MAAHAQSTVAVAPLWCLDAQDTSWAAIGLGCEAGWINSLVPVNSHIGSTNGPKGEADSYM